MGAVDHWHPVLPAAALTKAPAKVVLDGHEIAVFRTESGALGAVASEFGNVSVCTQPLFDVVVSVTVYVPGWL